ncbi:hypothetical protein AAG570_010168 [Ranatra chinensis]|uniref:Uncharacterized protein n=1 Tax=Ranatra chinensis TaxID=642074 RepID=A0ABD0YLS0_9HEMI
MTSTQSATIVHIRSGSCRLIADPVDMSIVQRAALVAVFITSLSVAQQTWHKSPNIVMIVADDMSLKAEEASKRQNMFYQNKKQEMMEIGYGVSVVGRSAWIGNRKYVVTWVRRFLQQLHDPEPVLAIRIVEGGIQVTAHITTIEDYHNCYVNRDLFLLSYNLVSSQ